MQTVRKLNILGEINKFAKGFDSAQLLPNIMNGQATGDINFKLNDNNYKCYKMRITKQELVALDSFFQRFGYKVNQTKVPYYHSRENWNFVKVGESEVVAYGSFDVDALELINEIFRNGVTIWHHHDIIGNYTLDNPIIAN